MWTIVSLQERSNENFLTIETDDIYMLKEMFLVKSVSFKGLQLNVVRLDNWGNSLRQWSWFPGNRIAIENAFVMERILWKVERQMQVPRRKGYVAVMISSI